MISLLVQIIANNVGNFPKDAFKGDFPENLSLFCQKFFILILCENRDKSVLI